MARWSVQIIGGKRTELLGYVRAADERKALAEAIKVFEVPADWRTRIIVVRPSQTRRSQVQIEKRSPPMTLGNMRELGVHHLIAFCHNDG